MTAGALKPSEQAREGERLEPRGIGGDLSRVLSWRGREPRFADMREGFGTSERPSAKSCSRARGSATRAERRFQGVIPARVHITPGEGRNRVYHVKCSP